ncbi:TolC family protein [Pigmentiphaga kullae]|uniref:Cobalt-zinc-cadmium efflux system outer membrane protein n=1 Tax=Pigmentiphaga kullae TaxID=151784 RepID=A0A4Q7NMY5_9BURK|nr:TolC family protein [Pigmentiphaga kullae]RZS86574.1 cobalt-zinc-cadmium efflux system outer membrane protein [Pigmentiphaga kullae]
MRSLVLWLALVANPIVPALAQPFSSAPPAVAAEPAAPLTLDVALALSASQNAALQAAAKEVDALDGSITQAGLLPNPELSLSMEDTRRETRTTAAQIGIPIELGGKRTARVVAAQRAQNVAVANLTLARANVRAATVGAFFEVLIAQEGVELAQASYGVAQKATDIAKRRVASGKVPPLEETRATVEQGNAELALTDARARLEGARRFLVALWGGSEPAFIRAVGDLEQLPDRGPVDVLLRDLGSAPELVAGRLEIERRKAVVDVERSKQYPDVTISAGSQRSNDLGRNQTLIGVSIPLPFFNRNQGNLYEAKVRADQAQDQYRSVEIAMRNELSQAAIRLSQARAGAQMLRNTLLPGAQQAYDVATKGFEAGKFSFIDVLDAQRTLFQSRIRYLTTLADSYQAAIVIDRVLGR